MAALVRPLAFSFGGSQLDEPRAGNVSPPDAAFDGEASCCQLAPVKKAIGKVKSYNSEKAFGFLLHAELAGDIWFRRDNLPLEDQESHLVGVTMRFDLFWAADGKPQARNLLRSEVNEGSPLDLLQGRWLDCDRPSCNYLVEGSTCKNFMGIDLLNVNHFQVSEEVVSWGRYVLGSSGGDGKELQWTSTSSKLACRWRRDPKGSLRLSVLARAVVAAAASSVGVTSAAEAALSARDEKETHVAPGRVVQADHQVACVAAPEVSMHTLRIATRAFDPTHYGDGYLRLQIGGSVKVINEEDGWCWGEQVDPEDGSVKLGWFPPTYVQADSRVTIDASPGVCLRSLGTATRDFNPTPHGSDYLRLNVGDVVKSGCEVDGWCWGERVDPSDITVKLGEGWFPPTYVQADSQVTAVASQEVGLHTLRKVTRDFDPTPHGSDYLRLNVGDVLRHIREEDGWCWGEQANPKDSTMILAEGWYPPTYAV